MLDFARGEPFDPAVEDCLVHITTGPHVAQICLFLLTVGRYLPGRLLRICTPFMTLSCPNPGIC
ncbi:MAG: RNA repair transcriptional activator RtcR family protein [Rhizorhabdus sp.]